MFVPGGSLRLIVRRDIVDGCKIFDPKKDKEKPKYAMIPHFYTCPVLKSERRNWAISRRLEGKI